MLATLLATQSAYFDTLARSWLLSGATAFAVWANGVPIGCWPPNTQVNEATLTEEIRVGGLLVGELRVTGMEDPAAKARLYAEAGLISSLIQSAQNLHIVTAELIDTQDQLLAMYDLTQAMRDYLDLGKVLDQLAQETARLVKVEATFVLVQRPDGSWLIKQYPEPVLDLITLEHLLNIAQATGQELLFSEEDVAVQKMRFRNLLLMPIQLRGAANAALGLINKESGDFFSPDIKLTRAIAEQAGAQIENALLYQENLEQAKLQTEMELAQRVQLNLLPHQLPLVADLDFWAGSRPALHVGGDFYDFLEREERPFTFTVGDISGKGLPAAILMAMTRTVIRSKVNNSPAPTPEAIIDRSNEELYDDFTEVNMFATIFVGQYDPINRQLLYANAGHSPVIYCPAGGTACLMEADGTPLGILPVSLSKNQQLAFGPGDVLVVATDGLSEAHNTQDEMFGYQRLLDLIEELSGESAQVIADGLNRAVKTFSDGKPQDDDQTVIVLKSIATPQTGVVSTTDAGVKQKIIPCQSPQV